MKKQDKQIIINDFKKVIEELNINNNNLFICTILDYLKTSSISIKYFKESKDKAKIFTLKSNLPESWLGNISWWDMYICRKEVIDLKIAFLESLIKELEEE